MAEGRRQVVPAFGPGTAVDRVLHREADCPPYCLWPGVRGGVDEAEVAAWEVGGAEWGCWGAWDGGEGGAFWGVKKVLRGGVQDGVFWDFEGALWRLVWVGF